MQPLDLESAQAVLHRKIFHRATELGYDAGKIEPIYDGVVAPAAYLAASPRLMWILKEPYDDWDENGAPCGGGWTMFKDVAERKTLAESVNANPALRNVAYASHAILNGIGSYSDEPWISDAPDAYEKALQSIAFVNIGKMPAGRTTDNARLFSCYARWKDILFEQMELYDSDMVVFGNTLQCFAPEMGIDLSKPLCSVTRGGSTVDVHAWRGKRILWAPHPAAHVPPGEWVDSVIEAARCHPKAAPNKKTIPTWKKPPANTYLKQNGTTNRRTTMSQVHANPDDLREFASRLQACGESIAEEASATSAAFTALGDTWNDAKRAEFEESFNELLECVRRFTASCDDQVPYLRRLADHLDDFNNSFC